MGCSVLVLSLLLCSIVCVCWSCAVPEANVCAHMYKDSNCLGSKITARAGSLEDGRLRGSGLRRMKRKSKGTWSDSISSVAVGKNCILTLYDNDYFGGKSNEFNDHDTYLDLKRWNFNDKASSYKCTCKEPEPFAKCDDLSTQWRHLLTCTGNSLVVSQCKYAATVSNTVISSTSEEVEKGLSIKVGTSASTPLKMFKVSFDVTSDYRVRTSTSESASQTVSETYESSFSVPINKTLVIKQVVASCGKAEFTGKHFKPEYYDM